MFYFLFFTHEKKKIKKLLKFISIILIYNFWWYFLFFFQESQSSFSNINLSNSLSSHYNNSQNFILNIFGLSFLDRNFFNNVLDFKIFYLSLYLFAYYKFFKLEKNLFINFTLISLLILTFISSEINSNLLQYFKIFLFEFKIFNIFRSPQNLLFLYPLLFSIIFYFVFFKLKITNQFLLICIFLYPWIWEGDLGHDKLKNNSKKLDL